MAGRIKACLPSLGQHPIRFGLIAVVAGLLFFLGWRHMRAWSQWSQASQAEARGDYLRQREHLSACLEIWPGSAATHFWAARTSRRCGLLQEAQTHLARSLELGASAQQVILEKYLLRVQLGDLDGVEAKLLAFLSKDDPDSLVILEVLTRKWLDDFRLSEALSCLELWLKKKPDDREALLRRGWVLERMANTADAIQCYQTVLELDPERDKRNKDPVRLQLAELFLQRNQPDEALPHLLVLAERHPQNPNVLLGLVRCWSARGQTEKADPILAGLLKDRPQDPQVLAERGRIYLKSTRADLAEPFLRQAEKTSPWDKQIIYLLSQCLERLKKMEEARFYEDRLQQIRKDEKRMRVLMEELMCSPRDAALRFQIGQIFLRHQMGEEAERWLLSALHYDPDHEDARQALAKQRNKAGKTRP
jgi:tetratricopeptide (TPR) repeat protein